MKSLRTQMLNFIPHERTITELCLIILIVTLWGKIAENMHSKKVLAKETVHRDCVTPKRHGMDTRSKQY